MSHTIFQHKLCHNFVTHSLSHTIFQHKLCHNFVTQSLSRTTCSHTTLSHTPSFRTNFVTTLSHTHTLSLSFIHNLLTHTHNFVTNTTCSHTQLCHTPSFNTNFVTTLSHTHTLSLSHTTCSHTTFSHTHSLLTHNFVTHHLSTQTLSHTLFHTQHCRRQLCHTIFAWQAFRVAGGTWRHPPSGVALGGIDCGTYSIGLALVARLGPVRPVTPRHFAWQAWRLHGRRGAWQRQVPFCLAGVALTALGGLALVVRLGSVALFAWLAWHLVTSTVTLHGRRGASRHQPSFCVAGVALTALGGLLWRAWGRRKCNRGTMETQRTHQKPDYSSYATTECYNMSHIPETYKNLICRK